MVYNETEKHVTLTLLLYHEENHMFNPLVLYYAGNTACSMWCHTNTFLCVVYVFQGSN